jgi:hypothetical protein
LFPEICFILIKFPVTFPSKPFVPMSVEDRQVNTREHEGEQWDSWETRAEC